VTELPLISSEAFPEYFAENETVFVLAAVAANAGALNSPVAAMTQSTAKAPNTCFTDFSGCAAKILSS
jgi:hypothetical protein